MHVFGKAKRIYVLVALVSLFGSSEADELILPGEITPAHTETNTNQILANKEQSKPNPSELPRISAADAAKLISKHTHGKIVSVDLESKSMRYTVKILHNGRMKTLYVNAIDGRVSTLVE